MPALEEAVSELGGVVVSAVLVLLSAAEAVIDASLWLRERLFIFAIIIIIRSARTANQD